MDVITIGKFLYSLIALLLISSMTQYGYNHPLKIQYNYLKIA